MAPRIVPARNATPRLQGLYSHYREDLSPPPFGGLRVFAASIHVRDATGCVSRGDRGRWPRTGAKMHTQRAAAQAARSRRDKRSRHRVLGGDCRNSGPTARRSQRPKAVVRKLRPPGAVQSKPQTPRAGRWRNGGLADLTSGLPSRREAWRTAGLSGPRRPAPPSLREARHPRKIRAHPRRGNDGGCAEQRE